MSVASADSNISEQLWRLVSDGVKSNILTDLWFLVFVRLEACLTVQNPVRLQPKSWNHNVKRFELPEISVHSLIHFVHEVTVAG